MLVAVFSKIIEYSIIIMIPSPQRGLGEQPLTTRPAAGIFDISCIIFLETK